MHINKEIRTAAIVIPCRNEEKYIARCLDSILAQVHSLESLHTYVCDGRSDDKTQEIIRSYSEKYPQIHLLINEKQSTPFALNLGIKASSADVTVILGAHAELYPDYIENCVKAFENGSNIGCTGGIIENVYENEVAEVIGKAMSSSFGVGNAHFRTGNNEGFVDTVAFGAYKREVFEKIGYFDEELIRNQDDEFNFRLSRAGFSVFLDKKIRSKYYVRAAYDKLFSQYLQYGYWKVYVNKKHKAVTTIRQVVPLLFVLYLMAGAVVSMFSYLLCLFYILGLLFYLFMAIANASMLSKNAEQLLPIVRSFFILHFSYGWGYLKGIIDFFILGKQIKKQEALTR